jgi:hypothetical protein
MLLCALACALLGATQLTVVSSLDAAQWSIYLPYVVHTWTPPEPPNCARDIPQDNVPCLNAIGQIIGSTTSFTILAGCAQGGTMRTSLRYDGYGRVSGYTFTIENAQGRVHYRAVVDIEYDSYGRKLRYTGRVSGDGFPAYDQTVENHYDPYGKNDRASVTKSYVDSGCTYTMDLTPCWLGDRWSGYKVRVYGNGFNGEQFSVGSCS